MAYDEQLAARIRDLVRTAHDVTEKKMFGGLAFLVGGNIAVSASGKGGILVRVDPDDTDAYLAEGSHVTTAIMGGREMNGWLRVDAEHVGTDAELAPWVERSTSYARSLPPKR